MPDFAESLANAARNAWCDRMSWQLSTGNYSLPFTRPIQSGFEYDFLANAHRLVCNREPPPPSPNDYNGGQCSGVLYVVQYTYKEYGSEPFTSAALLYGPILGGFIRPDVDDIDPTFEGQSFFITAGQMTEEGLKVAPIKIRFSPVLESGRILAVYPQDGSPDDCGDRQPDDLEDPSKGGIVVNLNYTNKLGLTVPLTGVAFVTDVSLSFDGSVTATVNVKIGDINIPVTVNVQTGDVNVGGPFSWTNPDGGGTGDTTVIYRPPGDTRPGPQPDDFTPSPSRPLPDGNSPEIEVPKEPSGDDIEEPPPKEPEKVKVIRGVAVTVTRNNQSRSTQIGQTENPDIFAPSLGFVNFRVKLGDNTTYWTSDQPVKNYKNFIPCPWDGGAIDVKGTPNKGVSWILTPIYSVVDAVPTSS